MTIDKWRQQIMLVKIYKLYHSSKQKKIRVIIRMKCVAVVFILEKSQDITQLPDEMANFRVQGV